MTPDTFMGSMYSAFDLWGAINDISPWTWLIGLSIAVAILLWLYDTLRSGV